MTKIEGYRQLENIGNYEIWYGSYRIDGKTCKEYVAYKLGTNKAEGYKISRASLKSLRREIEQN
jgi:hypothetical protein